MANEKFLDAFRSLDTELKQDNIIILDFENSLTDNLSKERLKVCRIMRNYMSHNDTDFLATTNEQIKFLDGLTESIKKKAHTAKDELKKVKLIKATTPMKDIISQIDKYPIVVIETKSGLYLMNKDDLIHQLAQGNKKPVIPTKLPKYKYVSKLTRIDKISEGIYIVTSDGTPNSDYCGILIV